jgi:hypothetical protein
MRIGIGVLGKLFLWFGAALFLSTCGSSGGGGNCGKVAPCGGDVVGNWTVSGACITAASLAMQIAPNCSNVMVNTATIDVTGNASFNADGTYTLMETTTVSATGTLPASCLMLSGVTLTCAEFDGLLQAYIATNPGMLESAHCAGTTDCSCNFTLAPQILNQMGTYNTLGSPTLTLNNASDGMTYGTQYCVQGNQMHTIRVNATMPMGAMGQVNIDEDTIFTKN